MGESDEEDHEPGSCRHDGRGRAWASPREPSEARDRDRDRGSDFNFSLQFGNPYPYYGQRYYQPYYAPRAYYCAPRRAASIASGTNAHVAWCYNRYRSYRAYDNSYQPFNGPRRECISPYYG